MYGNTPQLGDISPLAQTGIGIAQGLTSKLVGMGASFIASSLPAIASVAGPIGTIVGFIVSAIMSLFKFGPKPKDPIYGLGIAVPRADPIARLGRVLNLLEKPLVSANACWGMPNHQDPRCVALFQTITAIFNQGTKGAMIISSGGTPEAQKSVIGADWVPVQQKMKQFTDPFRLSLQNVKNPEIKKLIEDYDLGYKRSQDYHLVLPGETQKPAPCDPATQAYKRKSQWCLNNLLQNYTEVLVTRGQNLSSSLNKGLTGIGEQMNKGFIEIAGWDVINGVVINEEKAKIAFTPPATSITEIFGSSGSFPWLLAIGGILLLSDKRN